MIFKQKRTLKYAAEQLAFFLQKETFAVEIYSRLQKYPRHKTWETLNAAMNFQSP